MKVLLLCQYYPPEQVLVWAHELARELLARGHEVTALTAFPNRDQARIYEGYRGKLYHRETMDGVTVARSWIYATKSKRFYPRALNFGSFCTSSLLTGLLKLPRPDVIYVMIPALPLAVTARLLAWAKRSRLIVNVQDIHPRVAVEYGMLKNRAAVRFFEGMERWVYRHADKVAVISEGMREDLVSRGVPDDKVRVVENWADPNFITPGAKENEFRDELRAEGRFVLTYSGGINNNANLEPVVEAAELLRDEPFLFAIVGDGQYKPHLVELAEKKSLDNVRFPAVSAVGSLSGRTPCGGHEFRLAQRAVGDDFCALEDLQTDGSGPPDPGGDPVDERTLPAGQCRQLRQMHCARRLPSHC